MDAAGLPRYRFKAKTRALKIKEVQAPEMPKFSGPVCRGDFMLNTACRQCERCRWVMAGNIVPGATLVPEEEGFSPFEVSREFMARNNPQAGGYFVIYEDGPIVFVPASLFEKLYQRID